MTKKILIIFISLIAFRQVAIAGLPVLPSGDQRALLASQDGKLTANKILVYDFTRIVLSGRRLEQASTFLGAGYIQHNPNVETGLQGFLDFFSKLGGPRAIPDEVNGLVAIQAEGNIVTMAFVNNLKDASGEAYSTTWFDMFRIEDGKIVEHWDCDTK